MSTHRRNARPGKSSAAVCPFPFFSSDGLKIKKKKKGKGLNRLAELYQKREEKGVYDSKRCRLMFTILLDFFYLYLAVKLVSYFK